MAIGAAGLAAAAASPGLTGAQAATMGRPIPPLPIPPGYYPPRSTGITGQPDSVIDGIVQIDGFPNPTGVHDASGGPGIRRPAFNTGESYDVVIVGAGISGLSAAKYYRDRFGPDAKILLVDPLPDFGGHAHRNEFITRNAVTGADQLLLRTGGAVNLDSPYTWSETSGAFLDVPPSDAALDILDYLDVDLNAFPSTSGPGTPTATYGLAGYLLFSREEWGVDSVQRTRGLPGEDEQRGGVARLRRPAAVLAGREGRHRAHPNRHDDRLDRRQTRSGHDARAASAPADDDLVQAVADGLPRRA